MKTMEHYFFLLFEKGNILSVLHGFLRILRMENGFPIRHYFPRERGAPTKMKHLYLSGNVGNVGNVIMAGNKGNVSNVRGDN
jgi:hypothetical protein